MSRILVIKTAALGDVLRTTAILPGLHQVDAEASVTWLTAPGAVPLVDQHPMVHEVVAVEPKNALAVEQLAQRWQGIRWKRVLSLDDERPLCRLATAMTCDRLSGAHVRPDDTIGYTDDVAPWFDMGLLSRFGKEHADRLKVANQRSHPAIFASMLGIPEGRPALHLPRAVLEQAAQFASTHDLHSRGLLVGLNTGAGGRWPSKGMPIERVAELTARVHRARNGRVTFLVLGGPEEAERNRALLAAIASQPEAPRAVDGGTGNGLREFAALVDRCDLLVTSDSLALHMALARRRKVVVFFAPTSAAEIELWGLGEKVVSTAPDYCSYRPDADNRSITAERVAQACLRVLAQA